VRLPTSFKGRLALAVVAGLAVRIAYVLIAARKIAPIGDAVTYHEWARTIAAGTGWVHVPHAEIGLVHVRADPSAEHPPLFSLVLAGFWKLGVHGYTAQKLVTCAFGAATVALVGLAGREAAGERAGLIAAALAAVYPLLWVADGSLLAESLYGPLIAGAMLAALRFSRSPHWKPAAALGALVGLAALTRGEAVLLVVLLLIPLALTARAAPRERLRLGAVMLLASALVIAPWTARNLSRFQDPVLISTNSNATFAGANCAGTYHGDTLGMWRLDCYSGSPRGDESQQASFYRERGLEYVRGHAGRLPVVLAARLGRAWDVYRPLQGVRYEFFEGRSRWASRFGLALYYPTLLLAAFGVVVLRRRRAPLLALVAFPMLVCAVAVLYYGITRFRFAAEPALIVLAAVAVDELLARRSNRGARDGEEQQADRGHLPVPVDPGVHQPAR
jgi:4-amino-4-deoxy-L-arabinose transferase-like glycosyltransferase